MKLKIMTAQIKTKTGDLEGNTNRIIDGIQKAIDAKVDIVVFPETAITGYCAGGLFDNTQFVNDAIKAMNERIVPTVPDDLLVILGNIFVKDKTLNNFPILHNSAFLIQGSKIIGKNDKRLLANTGHHEDRKYFEPGKSGIHKVIIKNTLVNIGVPVCEDIWHIDHYENIVDEMVKAGAQLIISINQSFFHYRKNNERKQLVYRHVIKNDIPMVYVNSVGVGDIVKNIMIFDGGSFIFDNNTAMVSVSKRFEEDFSVGEVHINYIDTSVEKYKNWEMTKDKYEEIFNSLVFVQKEVFNQLGLKRAQVHLSGGIDSALVGTITKLAMGKENTVFITNPTEFNSEETFNLAVKLAETLGIELNIHEIGKVANEMYYEHTYTYGDNPSEIAYGSAQAIIRTAAGIMDSHRFKSGIVATGNHTEIVLGWATFHDIGSVGVHALIGDLTKVEVFELSRWINNFFETEIIPAELYDGRVKPHAELGDNDGDPFDYNVVSGIAALLIRERMTPTMIINLGIKYIKKEYEDYFPYDINITDSEWKEMVWMVYGRSKKSVFKAAQSAPIVVIAPRSRGFSNRETIFNFYKG